MDYSPWSEREIWLNLKRSKISETGEAMPTKFGFHAFQVNLYLHEFFEPFLFFDPHGIVHGLIEILAVLKANEKRAKYPKPEKPRHQIWFPCISHQPILA